MNIIIEKLKRAAQAHGEDSGEPEHQAGDLEEMLTTAWNLMSVSQKEQFVKHECVAAVIETGAHSEFSQETLVEEIQTELSRMNDEISSAGYFMQQGQPGQVFWESDDGTGQDFLDHRDCILDAHMNMMSQKTQKK